MSQLDDVLLLCEDIDQGTTLLLLEAARAALQTELVFARRVTIRASGSKAGLPSAIDANRRVNPRTFAVRDRDFLLAPLLATQRAAAFANTDRKPWPLKRHCIESYLTGPELIAEALELHDAEAVLDELATKREWLDACRATGDRLAYEGRRIRPKFQLAAASEGEAIAIVEAEFAKFGQAISGLAAMKNPAAALREFHDDFVADGPLRARVDGKELLGALESRLGPAAHARERLLSHAGKNPPKHLVDELRELLTGIENQVTNFV